MVFPVVVVYTWQYYPTRLRTAESVGETGLPPPPCLSLLSILPNNSLYFLSDIGDYVFYHFIFINYFARYLKLNIFRPGWCSSVDGVRACEPKGRWFDSPSGHTPGLQARSPVGGAREATTH